MVHALEEIRRLLRPHGTLIDIHPVQEAPFFEVRQQGRVLFAEPEPGYDCDEDVHQADKALARVLKRRLFSLELRREFDFLTYGSSVQELLDFLDEASAFHEGEGIDERESAEEQVLYNRLEEQQRSAGAGVQVVMHERARITRLRPIG
ncbi:MAG TPA: hypothetical protein VJK02_14920 [Anaerolineales bacterium]|nr:hypothetical protein [Anaerolineales bacterium]